MLFLFSYTATALPAPGPAAVSVADAALDVAGSEPQLDKRGQTIWVKMWNNAHFEGENLVWRKVTDSRCHNVKEHNRNRASSLTVSGSVQCAFFDYTNCRNFLFSVGGEVADLGKGAYSWSNRIESFRCGIY